jgi:hypothetical protein
MSWEKVEKPKKYFRKEMLGYPTPRPCGNCNNHYKDMVAVWWTKPNPPGKMADVLLCFRCAADIDEDLIYIRDTFF